VPEYAEVPGEIVARLRSVCLGLPEAYEEPAWVGTRWRIRKRTFAHVLTVAGGWPPAYAEAVRTDGPSTVLTFRAPASELHALSTVGYPFYRPGWAPDVVGMVLDEDADWAEIAELLTDSYRVLAPRKLVALLDRA
jgi:YjbR